MSSPRIVGTSQVLGRAVGAMLDHPPTRVVASRGLGHSLSGQPRVSRLALVASTRGRRGWAPRATPLARAGCSSAIIVLVMPHKGHRLLAERHFAAALVGIAHCNVATRQASRGVVRGGINGYSWYVTISTCRAGACVVPTRAARACLLPARVANHAADAIDCVQGRETRPTRVGGWSSIAPTARPRTCDVPTMRGELKDAPHRRPRWNRRARATKTAYPATCWCPRTTPQLSSARPLVRYERTPQRMQRR